MASIYGHKWTGTYGTKVDPTWKRAMQSMPVDRLKMALARCGHRDDTWPPSLPEFMQLAHVQPSEVGAPDFRRAFAEACRHAHPCADWQSWSHRCVYWAATWTGLSDLMERGERMRAQFDREYQRALDCADDLSEPPKGRLPTQTQRDRTAEQERAAQEWLPALRKQLAGGGS